MQKFNISYKTHQFILGIILPLLFMGTGVSAMNTTENIKDKPTMILESSAFKNNESIPVPYTSDGPQVFPPLQWKGAPKETKSFVLICEDPDGSGPTKGTKETKNHVILYNIPATLDHIDEGGKNLTAEVRFGINSRGELVWAGPRPPEGTGVHHYNFTLYALDTVLKLEKGQTKEQVKKAIEGHILAEAKLTGLYQYNKDLH